MNPQDPLANLHPIREPQLIGWWPLAPGWWILIGLVVLALIALAVVLYKKYQANAYRRLAAAQMENIQAQWLHNGDSRAYAAATNALLKSVAVYAFPARDVASYSGAKWTAFLNSGLDGAARFPESFTQAAYQEQVSSSDCQNLLEPAQRWIKSHGVTS